jgi:hypothetical protein
MSGGLRYCSKCRRLFVPKEHHALCSNCVHEVRSRSEPALLLRGDAPTRPCERCQKRERMANQRFCLTCQLDVHRNLSEQANNVTPTPGHKRRLEGTVRELIAEKRRRTGSYRFYPAIQGVKNS